MGSDVLKHTLTTSVTREPGSDASPPSRIRLIAFAKRRESWGGGKVDPGYGIWTGDETGSRAWARGEVGGGDRDKGVSAMGFGPGV